MTGLVGDGRWEEQDDGEEEEQGAGEGGEEREEAVEAAAAVVAEDESLQNLEADELIPVRFLLNHAHVAE